MELLLIRHAQTTSNVSCALDTALPGADLTDLGAEQIAACGAALAAEPLAAIYTSPALRAVRTAAAVAAPHGLEPVVRPGLVEISAGDWEMSTEPEHWVGYRDLVSAWFDGDYAHQLPGGETGDIVLARFDAVVDEIATLGLEQVAIVAHGGVLRTWSAARGENVTADLARRHPLSNTGVVRVTGQPGSWTVTSWDGIELDATALAGSRAT